MPANIVAGVLGWLRAGYPEGVPPKDYIPLLALLRRTLDDEDFAQVLDEVRAQDDPVRSADIREAIERVTNEDPNEEDVRRVAAHLAAGGWPLSGGAQRLAAQHDPAQGQDQRPDDGPAAPSAPSPPGLIQRVVAWLRAGYPAGVPDTDYAPLLALLRRRLTDTEVTQVARQLAAEAGADGVVDGIDARVLMSSVLDDLPSDADVQRVSDRLGELGTSLA